MRKIGSWRAYRIQRLAKDHNETMGFLRFTVREFLADGDLTFFLQELRVFIGSQVLRLKYYFGVRSP